MTQWTVNQYDAAACITLQEINRKIKQVFDETDRLPKTWTYEGSSQLNAELECPYISWQTSLSNGVKLQTPIKSGSFKQKTIDYTTSSAGEIVDEEIQLQGLTVNVETDMGRVDVSGSYMLTFDALEKLYKASKVSADEYKTLKTIINLFYENESAFWQACTNSFAVYYKHDIVKAADSGLDALTRERLGYNLTLENLGRLFNEGKIPQRHYDALAEFVSSKPFSDEATFWAACMEAFGKKDILTSQHKSDIIAAANLTTVDTAFTVESLYANMQSPNMMHGLGNGYMLNDVALGSAGSLNLPETTLSALRNGSTSKGRLLGQVFPNDTSFWSTCSEVLTATGISIGDQNSAKQPVVEASQIYMLSQDDVKTRGNLRSLGVDKDCVSALRPLTEKAFSDQSSFWAAAQALMTDDEVDQTTQEDNKANIVKGAVKFALTITAVGKLPALTTYKNDGCESVPSAVVDALKSLRNIAFADQTTFWNACQAAIQAKTGLANIPDKQKQTILTVGRAVVSTVSGDTRIAIAEKLKAIYTDPSYKDNYIFGLAKIPSVRSTVGPLAPRKLRFTRYPLAYNPGDDSTKGSLNWNLMASKDPSNVPPLPPTGGQAGVFNTNPVPEHYPGVIYVSYKKIIMDILLPAGLARMGLDSSKWAVDEAKCQLTTNQDVSIDFSQSPYIKDGKLSAGNQKISIEKEQNRIKVDFQVDDIEFEQKWYDEKFSSLPGGVLSSIGMALVPGFALTAMAVRALIRAFRKNKFRAKWSGYFHFALNQSKDDLDITYSFDRPSIERVDDNQAWRVIADIATLGLDEFDRILQQDSIGNDLSRYLSQQSPQSLSDLRDSVQLPGGAVFDFSDVALTDLGLQARLTYQSAYEV